ncbi:hypothetical protein V1280_001801 [Bradyrhizobium sp. AZCC 2230]
MSHAASLLSQIHGVRRSLIPLSRVGSFRAGRHGDLMRGLLSLFLVAWCALTPARVWAGSMTLLGVGKAGAAAPPNLAYIGATTGSTASNIASVSGVNIGTASFDRLVVVVFTGIGFNSVTASCSIAGAATTLVVQSPGFNGSQTTICSATVTSGTTGNISITYGFVADGVTIAFDVYTIKSLTSMTAAGTGGASGSASTLTTGSVSISGAAVAIIGSAQRGSNSTTDVVSGTSGSFVQDHPNFVISGFSRNTVASATALAGSSGTFTATWNGTEASSIAAAAWR